jgi:hypothetical protein
MPTGDPWLDWKWDVYSAQDAGGPYEKPLDQIGHFQLTTGNDPDDHSPGYVVSRHGLVMPPCWSDSKVCFHDKGAVEPSGVDKYSLAPWDGTDDVDRDWMDAANLIRRLIAKDVRRLESAFYPQGPRGPKEKMYLIRVDEAVEDGSPLLVLRLEATPKGLSELQDGTAHGGGHKGP